MYSPDCVREEEGVEYRATLVARTKDSGFDWFKVNLESDKSVSQDLVRQHFALILDLVPGLTPAQIEAWLAGVDSDNADFAYKDLTGYTLGIKAGGEEVELYVNTK